MPENDHCTPVMSGHKVLVTGAAGFIGFHVAQKCQDRGASVIGLDNFCPYYDVTLKRDRAALLSKKGISVVEQAVEDKAALQRLILNEKITHIIHLAAQAGVRYSLQDPDSYVRSNIDGFLSVLETVRLFPSIRTVWASSSSVYGANRKLPFCEDDVTDSPTNFYGATKKANEAMAYAYHHLFHIPLIGLRFFTVYGPWGRPDMAYFLFAERIMRGEPIDLFGGGKLRRDFTYIDDIVSGILAAVTSTISYGIYNLGNCHSESVCDLVAYLERSMGKKAILRERERPPGDMHETWADIQKAKRDLGFQPTTPLRDGIAKFVAWFNDYKSIGCVREEGV